jgi:hypothetical protein
MFTFVRIISFGDRVTAEKRNFLIDASPKRIIIEGNYTEFTYDKPPQAGCKRGLFLPSCMSFINSLLNRG